MNSCPTARRDSYHLQVVERTQHAGPIEFRESRHAEAWALRDQIPSKSLLEKVGHTERYLRRLQVNAECRDIALPEDVDLSCWQLVRRNLGESTSKAVGGRCGVSRCSNVVLRPAQLWYNSESWVSAVHCRKARMQVAAMPRLTMLASMDEY